MDNLTNRWKEAKIALTPPNETAADLIAEATKKKSVLYFHYGNIMVLIITLIVISFFFLKVAHFKTMLSHAGICLMVGALIIRILIEIYSSIKFNTINLEQEVSRTVQEAVRFYTYRKRVHGPVTIGIVASYAIGFYSLSPEFNIYIPLKWMIMMHLSFLLGAVLLIWQIRKGIKKEMRNLNNIVGFSRELETS
jgi:hypothetical protein